MHGPPAPGCVGGTGLHAAALSWEALHTAADAAHIPSSGMELDDAFRSLQGAFSPMGWKTGPARRPHGMTGCRAAAAPSHSPEPVSLRPTHAECVPMHFASKRLEHYAACAVFCSAACSPVPAICAPLPHPPARVPGTRFGSDARSAVDALQPCQRPRRTAPLKCMPPILPPLILDPFCELGL